MNDVVGVRTFLYGRSRSRVFFTLGGEMVLAVRPVCVLHLGVGTMKVSPPANSRKLRWTVRHPYQERDACCVNTEGTLARLGTVDVIYPQTPTSIPQAVSLIQDRHGPLTRARDTPHTFMKALAH